MRSMTFLLLTTSLVCAGLSQAQPNPDRLKEDSEHVKTWNRFAKQLRDLHERRIGATEIKTTSKSGGYRGQPDFYKEVTYSDSKTGRMLSRVQWERENPDQVHVMEVFFYDEQGRVTRDFTVAYLPTHRNAPIQTLIALHNYNGGLHAFRSFDASGNRIFERCDGTLQGKDVQLMLEDYEIEDAMRDPSGGVFNDPVYRACFGDLQETAGVYLSPQ